MHYKGKPKKMYCTEEFSLPHSCAVRQCSWHSPLLKQTGVCSGTTLHPRGAVCPPLPRNSSSPFPRRPVQTYKVEHNPIDIIVARLSLV